MKRTSVRSLVARLTSYVVRTETFSALACRGCDAPLDVHQPDPGQPDQFLATCSGCGRWSRVAPSAGGAGYEVLELPEIDDLGPSAAPPGGDGKR